MAKPRIVRADDLVAETYEKWAAKLPTSRKELARYYRQLAKAFRESGRPGMMLAPERVEPKFMKD
jgi:hypothetical protein